MENFVNIDSPFGNDFPEFNPRHDFYTACKSDCVR